MLSSIWTLSPCSKNVVTPFLQKSEIKTQIIYIIYICIGIWICCISKTWWFTSYVLRYSVCTLFYVQTNTIVCIAISLEHATILGSQSGKYMSHDLNTAHDKTVLSPVTTMFNPTEILPLSEKETIFSMISEETTIIQINTQYV